MLDLVVSEVQVDVSKLMTPERVIGAVLWSLAHNEMPDDLIYLVDENLTQETLSTMNLEGDLDIVIGMIHGLNMNPKLREGNVQMLQAEVKQTLKGCTE